VSARALLPSRAEGQAALATAALFALAYPPVPLLGPAFVCLAPAAIAVTHRADERAPLRASLRIGFWTGALAYGVTLYWIATALALYTKLAVLGWLAATVVLAIVVAVTFGALHLARRATRWPMVLLLPLVWIAGEMLLAHLGDLAFPWLPLGLTTASTPVLAQLADVSGVHGVSFWVAAVNGAVADMFLECDRRTVVARRALFVLASVAAVVGYGKWRMSTIRLLPMSTVAVVQPSIPQEDKWQEENQERIVGILADVTRRAMAGRPKLVVWPEAALPDFLFRHRDWLDTLATLAAPTRTPILLGVLDVKFRPPDRPLYYNGAMMVDGDGRVRSPVYHKRRLVPVVERVPFIAPDLVRGWSEYFGGYARGSEPVIFHPPIGAVGALVCYESIFPSLAREYRRGGAELLVNITNDAWFGRTLGPYQHYAHSVMRAIETRLPVVRAANTGISGYIDPLGRPQGRTELFERTAAEYLVDFADVRSPYVRLGDWVGMLSALVTVALIGAGWGIARLDRSEEGDA
jgi:apolipoprotein N-acyltransferase